MLPSNRTPVAHCCERMTKELEKGQGTNRFGNPDALLEYLPKFDEYGIIVHDGGSSIVQIDFCPWCGARLPQSKRDRWFEELEGLGIDPHSDTVPPEYATAEWWAKSG